MRGRTTTKDQMAARSPIEPREAVQPANLYTSGQADKSTSGDDDLRTSGQGSKATSPQTEEAASPQTYKPVTQLVHKYTTHLRPATIKAIKWTAVERDQKDYEIVQAALDAYLQAEG